MHKTEKETEGAAVLTYDVEAEEHSSYTMKEYLVCTRCNESFSHYATVRYRDKGFGNADPVSCQI